MSSATHGKKISYWLKLMYLILHLSFYANSLSYCYAARIVLSEKHFIWNIFHTTSIFFYTRLITWPMPLCLSQLIILFRWIILLLLVHIFWSLLSFIWILSRQTNWSCDRTSYAVELVLSTLGKKFKQKTIKSFNRKSQPIVYFLLAKNFIGKS